QYSKVSKKHSAILTAPMINEKLSSAFPERAHDLIEDTAKLMLNISQEDKADKIYILTRLPDNSCGEGNYINKNIIQMAFKKILVHKLDYHLEFKEDNESLSEQLIYIYNNIISQYH